MLLRSGRSILVLFQKFCNLFFFHLQLVCDRIGAGFNFISITTLLRHPVISALENFGRTLIILYFFNLRVL